MQKCFDEKDIQMLQEVISKMDPTVSYFVLVTDKSILHIWSLKFDSHFLTLSLCDLKK